MLLHMILFDSLSAFLQRVQDHVRHEYVWYVAGAFEEADYGKLSAFADKVCAAYDINLSPMQRSRRKAAGHGNVHLLGVKLKAKVVWILMATDGDNDFHLYEKNKKNLTQKDQRLVLMGFELVQLTRPVSSGGGSTWTWRLTESAYKGMETKIDDIAKRASSGEQAIAKAKETLLWLPMFRGIRVQVGKLFQRLRREWVTRHGDMPIPKLEELPFIRKQVARTVALDTLCFKK